MTTYPTSFSHRVLSGTAIFLTCAITAPIVFAEAADWLQWRGPGGNGVAAEEAKPPLQWSEEKNVKWKLELPGEGTSTPIVADGKVIVTVAQPTGKKAAATPGENREGANVQRRVPGRGPQFFGQEQGQQGGGRDGDRRSRRRGFNFDGSTPLPDFAKPYDKNNDGKLDETEQQAMRAATRSRRGGRGGFGRGQRPDELYRFAVICLDLETGKEVWNTAVKEEVPHEGKHRTNGYASASPVTDGKHIFAHFGSRGLFCLDMKGKVLWEKDFGDMRTRAGFGEGSSPALHGDTLVVNWDHEGESFIVALDKNTGKEKWKNSRDEKTSWSTPVIVEHGGKTQVIANATNKVAAYDLKDGKIIWESTGMTENVIPTPAIGDGVVYVMSGFRGSALQAIKLDATGKVNGTDSVVWSHDAGTPYVPSPLLYQGRLYFFQGYQSRLSCFDAKSGEEHFSRESVDLRDVYASPLGANGHVYLAGRKGNVVVIKAADELEVVHTNSLDDEFDASPVAVGGKLLLRGRKHLYCISE